MSWPLMLALSGLALALVQRWRQAHHGIGLEGATLQLALGLSIVGLLATALGLAGSFHALDLSVGLAVAALAIWPWRASPPVRRSAAPTLRARLVVAWLLVMVGLALRLPQIPSPLAGRDQGTYTLRAQHTLRTGELAVSVPLLEQESSAAASRPGPSDILGLYARSDEGWRRGVYESSYRPGFYLTERERGHVVPQFLHLHPMLMAVSGALLGREHVAAVMLLEALLALLAFYAVARRLWRSGPWAELALALLALSPVSIWVGRVALTETLTAGLFASAVLAALRARDGEPALLLRAALLFGVTAWVRGNAWITAPVVMGVLLLRPRVFRPGRSALLTLSLLLLGSVAVHASTGFPYLYDELHRLLPNAGEFGPSAVFGVAVLIVLLVVGSDLGLTLGLRRPPRSVLRGLGHTPKLLAALVVGILFAYVALRWSSPLAPYSRLDSATILLGPLALGFAALGLAQLSRAWRPRWRQADVWLLALACVPVITLALYARRNLPEAGLYYYGRYLVPELLPAALLLAVGGVRSLHRLLTSRRAGVGHGFAVAAAAGLLWTNAGVLVTQPQTRLQEFAGAGRIVSLLAEHTQPGAIVVAGGEGWHHGHTYNQVGGALAIGHGRTVLPYHSREAAYATLHELLVARPAATGVDPPPVYLLVNEASHAYTREDGALVAGIDDVLPAPFRAREAILIELITDRLTPVRDSIPIRVTRDALRMGLLEVELDSRVRTTEWTLSGASTSALWDAGLKLRGPRTSQGQWCLDPKRPLRAEFRAVPLGAGSLVVVAEPGTARHNEEWTLAIDGRLADLHAADSGRRERDTLGPIPLADAPKSIELRGSRHADPGAACPHGAVAQLRWLPPDRPALAETPSIRAFTITPTDDLGHVIVPVRWVSARAVSRYRPGTRPAPEIHARSLVLRPNTPLRFDPIFPPSTDGAHLADIVVTLTDTAVGPQARIVLRLNGREVQRFDPPDDSDSSWQSEVVRAPVYGSVWLELELVGDGDNEHHVNVRDIAIFGIGADVTSQLLP